MSKLIEQVLQNKEVRNQEALQSLATQLGASTAPWDDVA